MYLFLPLTWVNRAEKEELMAKKGKRVVEITPQYRQVLMDLAGPIDPVPPTLSERLDFMEVDQVEYFTETRQALATSLARKQKDGSIDPDKQFQMTNIDVAVKTDTINTVETVTRVERIA